MDLCCQTLSLQTSRGLGQAASLIPALAMSHEERWVKRRHISGFWGLCLSSSKDSKLTPESQRQRTQLQEQHCHSLLQKRTAPVLEPPVASSWSFMGRWPVLTPTGSGKVTCEGQLGLQNSHTDALSKEGLNTRQRKLCKPFWALHLLCVFR